MKSGVRWWTNSIIREVRDSERLYGLRQRQAKSDGVGCCAGPPFGYRSGQAFSKSARRGAPPVISVHTKLKTNPGYTSPLKWPTRQSIRMRSYYCMNLDI